VTVDTYEYEGGGGGGGGPVYMVVGLESGAVEMLSPAIIENRERSTLSFFAVSKSR
jgi:hypothetical protein